MKRLASVIGAAVMVAAILSSCTGAPAPTRTIVVTETVVAEPPAPSPSATVDAEEGDEADADPTARVQAVAGDNVVAATEDYPGEFVIETDIVDPRGDAGSPEALLAIEICEAVQDELGATHVRVQEEDGTTFVVLGGAYTECTEA